MHRCPPFRVRPSNPVRFGSPGFQTGILIGQTRKDPLLRWDRNRIEPDGRVNVQVDRRRTLRRSAHVAKQHDVRTSTCRLRIGCVRRVKLEEVRMDVDRPHDRGERGPRPGRRFKRNRDAEFFQDPTFRLRAFIIRIGDAGEVRQRRMESSRDERCVRVLTRSAADRQAYVPDEIRNLSEIVRRELPHHGSWVRVTCDLLPCFASVKRRC